MIPKHWNSQTARWNLPKLCCPKDPGTPENCWLEKRSFPTFLLNMFFRCWKLLVSEKNIDAGEFIGSFHDALTQTPVFCIAHLVKMSWISHGYASLFKSLSKLIPIQKIWRWKFWCNKTIKLWKLLSPKKTWMNHTIVHKSSLKKQSKWKGFLHWVWPYNYNIL